MIKFDQNGKRIWGVTWPTDSYSEFNDLTISGDNIYLVGSVAVDYGYNYGIKVSTILFKITSKGDSVWHQLITNDNADVWGSSIVVKNSKIYVLQNLEYSNSSDIRLSKYDLTGTLLDETIFNTTERSVGSQFLIDSEDNLYLAGYTNDTFDHLTSSGKMDNILFKWQE